MMSWSRFAVGSFFQIRLDPGMSWTQKKKQKWSRPPPQKQSQIQTMMLHHPLHPLIHLHQVPWLTDLKFLNMGHLAMMFLLIVLPCSIRLEAFAHCPTSRRPWPSYPLPTCVTCFSTKKWRQVWHASCQKRRCSTALRPTRHVFFSKSNFSPDSWKL